MRRDGREWDEIRPIQITTDYSDLPAGSALIEVGKTRVLCSATVEASVPSWRQGSGAGWVTAEYALLPTSTHPRTRRETRGLRGRTQEIQRLIGRSLRSAVDLKKIGERMIILDCDVLQADGGTRTAAITGAYVALALALKRLEAKGEVPQDVLLAQVAATSLGLVEGQLLLDLCYSEDFAASSDFNVIMTSDGRFIEVQGTAEGKSYSRQSLDAILDLAEAGIRQLLAIQDRVLADALEPKP
jgi:ribonuclease PH